MDNINDKWVKASYSEGQFAEQLYLSKLRKIGVRGSYHIYHLEQGNRYVVIFNNQQNLVELVDYNEEALFLIGFLKTSNNKFSYPGYVEGKEVELMTVARIQVVIPDVFVEVSEEPIRVKAL